MFRDLMAFMDFWDKSDEYKEGFLDGYEIGRRASKGGETNEK